MNAWALQDQARRLIAWIAEAMFESRKAADRLEHYRKAVAVLKRFLPPEHRGWKMVELVWDHDRLRVIVATAEEMVRVLRVNPNAYAYLAKDAAA